MKVLIDTNPLYTSRAGVCRYVNGLLSGLRGLAAGPETAELAWPVENLDYRQPARALKTAYRELVWPLTAARRAMMRHAPDILHTTANVFYRAPQGSGRVHTLYDLAVVRHPERFRRWHRSSWRRHLRKVAPADRILCISRFTADEAMSLLGAPADKLAVTYCGHSLSAVAAASDEEVASSIGRSAPAEFLLFVGSLEPGKNLDLLRQTYRAAEGSGFHLPPLLIVGARREGVAAESHAPHNWLYLGYQPDAVLVRLYCKAVALLFPSRYEGFGLPVLEAMALGCPVICSPVASLPEVGGDAVLYADQTPADYLRVIRRLLQEEPLRLESIAKGRAQASRFSWRRCAEETVSVYEEVLREKAVRPPGGAA